MWLDEKFSLKYPIIQGGMARVATGSFAAAISNACGLGLIGSGGMTCDMLKEAIHEATGKSVLSSPRFGAAALADALKAKGL